MPRPTVPDQAPAAIGPRVSVLIPAYNRQAPLDAAIDSVLAQTMPVAQIVVVDDGSDPPLDRARLAAIDSRIVVLRHSANRGQSAALATGLRAVTGDWLALLDSDDRWLPRKLAVQFAGLATMLPDAPAFAACNVLVDRGDAGTHPYNHRRPSEPLSEWLLIDHCSLQQSGLLLPTALARTIGFHEDVRAHHDWEMALRLVERGVALSYQHDCLVVYDGRKRGRASERVNVTRTLDWFRRSGTLITRRAQLSYYARALFPVDWRERPARAALRLIGYTLRAPGELPYLALRLWRRLRRNRDVRL